MCQFLHHCSTVSYKIVKLYVFKTYFADVVMWFEKSNFVCCLSPSKGRISIIVFGIVVVQTIQLYSSLVKLTYGRVHYIYGNLQLTSSHQGKFLI